MSANAAQFQSSGFIVLRQAFDAAALRAEIESALSAAPRASFVAAVESGTIQGQYVPMMCARTPRSLALLEQLGPIAEELLGAGVLPVRAKGVRYFGATPWHVDSTLELASVGFAAYLSPLRAGTGALRVVVGSHRGATAGSELALETEPGDLIAFDEHLSHSSQGGSERLQWRADYLRAPRSPDERALAYRYFSRIFAPDWDGGYDAEAFPSYGPDWQRSARPAVAALRELGVYQLAEEQEAFMRSQRARTARE
jgi:hypothetical protein